MAVTLTDEQFRELLARLTVTSQNSVAQSSVLNGNFSKCQTRFDGSKESDVNAFIDAICVYKDCTQVSDDNALKGLPMLFDGFAAQWYQGVKTTINSWAEALALLRTTFGPQKPPYRVYRELFATEQDSQTPTDIFVCKARAILAQLPVNTLTEGVQLDMIYGLLHKNIREKCSRDSITSFNELLCQARLIEESFERNIELETSSTVSKDNYKRVRCKYCKNPGHSRENCRKLLSKQSKDNEPSSSGSQKLSTRSQASSESLPSSSISSPVSCYGCGKIGYIRSNCPICSKHTETATMEFHSVDTIIDPRPRPILHVTISGHLGQGLVDTAAKQSVAGKTLFSLLKREGHMFEKKNISVRFADGYIQNKEVYATLVNVNLRNRVIPTKFIIFPEAPNHTLFGIDFLKDAKMVLDFHNDSWFFSDRRDNQFQLLYEKAIMPVSNSITEISTFENLRSDEGTLLLPEQRLRLSQFLEDYKNIFTLGGEATPYAQHYINTGDHPPVAVPPYRMSPVKKELLKKEIDKLLNEGIIEECESPWAAPVVLVPKKDGGVRLCVDYRRLNAVTVSDSYPLPRMDDLLQAAKRTSYMTTLDLRSGYHQVEVHERDRDKTTFVTPFGTFRYLRMPFGLKNAPGTFQRLIDQFRRGLSEVLILAYLDDIIVLSSTFDEHIKDLTLVFDRLKLFKLRVNREKCVFACSSVKYLGHLITPEGISVDPCKTEAISKRPPPRNVKEVQSFLQTASWYRRFINNFAAISRPLSDLTKKKSTWRWNTEQQTSFDTLKRLLVSAPILQQYDETQPYIIRTDSSNYALGAVLLQGQDADEHPIEYASRLLTPAEKNYSTSEQEALAVVFALEKFRGYVEARG